MAVVIAYEAETPNDVFTPMTIASALAKDPLLGVDDLEEIADHLMVYVNKVRRERIRECQ